MDVLLDTADLLLTVLWLAILARMALGWLLINHEHKNPPLLRLFSAIADPIVDPLRRVIPQGGPFDVTPWIAMAIIVVIQQMLFPHTPWPTSSLAE